MRVLILRQNTILLALAEELIDILNDEVLQIPDNAAPSGQGYHDIQVTEHKISNRLKLWKSVPEYQIG